MQKFIKKVCLCGDPAVGKTSLVRRYVTGMFSENYISTLGTVITKKDITIPEENCNVTMMIWDISGQAEFKRIHASAFKHAEGAFAVCDILRPQSAMNLYDWIANLRKYTNPDIPIIIMVNKIDLAGNNRSYMSKIEMILENLDYPILTTSAKTGQYIETGFERLAKAIVPIKVSEKVSDVKLTTMPESFENPLDFLDYITMRFSQSLGDDEMGMHMMRTQVEAEGIDFRRLTKEDARRLIDRLVKMASNIKGEAVAKPLRNDFMRAFNRCNW
ncbi:MAG: GTP-binding protein [Thermoplasmata archaeon]|nr:MAG: GTP-binding protein [Thermoplasmata archaeon]